MLSTYIQNIQQFIEEDLWKIKIKTLPKRKAFLFQQFVAQPMLLSTVFSLLANLGGESNTLNALFAASLRNVNLDVNTFLLAMHSLEYA